MNLPITVQGTINPDGVLELDQKVPLPSGPVLVTLQPVAQPSTNDGFWQRMEAIWAAQKARGHVPRSNAEIEAARQKLRDETEDEIKDALRIHKECRETPNEEGHG